MKKLATLDIETDPFLYGRMPLPFACGFYDGETYFQSWGDDCIADMITYLDAYKTPLEIFAHNGGKFDWTYFAHALDQPLSIIKTRLVRARFGKHTVRDSYALLPAPLRDFKKDKTDYSHFERGKRERYKDDISVYLKHDCVYLYEILRAFIDRLGDSLTIAGVAWREARKTLPVKIRHLTAASDAELRPFYFGGRVECFERGHVHGKLKLYDINSSYPNVMRNYKHPFGSWIYDNELMDGKIYFTRIIADSDGALPIRTDSGLQFPHANNMEFNACSHEIESGLRHHKLRIRKVLSVIGFDDSLDFSGFVDKYIAEKITAEKRGDKTMRTVYKLLLNNAYGKAAQDPSNFFDYALSRVSPEYEPFGEFDASRTLWRKPATITGHSYWDIAIGASITSAARAFLFDALQHATRPIYCDTDSILCTKLDAELHDTKLGAWKLEANATDAYIAGKKMYAIVRNGKIIKCASKGVPLNPREIIKLAKTSKPLIVKIDAPTLRLGKAPRFITRKIRET